MINALFAVDHYGNMGFNGKLPWPHNAADLANFQRHTMGHVVVMGRHSWDDPDMPKPLNGRVVYVATHKRTQHASTISGDIVEEVLKLEKRHPDKTIWIVGGPAIITACSEIVDRVHVTHFKGAYKADTKIDLKTYLTGFVPVRAEVANDFQSTFVKYAPIFARTRI